MINFNSTPHKIHQFPRHLGGGHYDYIAVHKIGAESCGNQQYFWTISGLDDSDIVHDWSAPFKTEAEVMASVEGIKMPS